MTSRKLIYSALSDSTRKNVAASFRSKRRPSQAPNYQDSLGKAPINAELDNFARTELQNVQGVLEMRAKKVPDSALRCVQPVRVSGQRQYIALDIGFDSLRTLESDPVFDDIHSDARYQALIERLRSEIKKGSASSYRRSFDWHTSEDYFFGWTPTGSKSKYRLPRANPEKCLELHAMAR